MPSFFSPYSHQFARVAVCVPRVAVAEPVKNGDQVAAMVADGDRDGAAVMLFPELCLSAYAIDDLLFQDALLDAVTGEIARLIELSRERMPVVVVGAPLRWQGRLYNCAVVIHRGRLLGVVPKIFLPNYREFYERRHFTSGEGMRGGAMSLAGQQAPFGIDLLFEAAGAAGFSFHIEICEDLWVPQPPSTLGAAAGADYLAAQGAEAGAHRGTFSNDERPGQDRDLLGLIGEIVAATQVPVIAAGGISGPGQVAAVLAAGAAAAQLGTAFLRCPQSGARQVHKDALADPRFSATAITRAFTGRRARGLVNQFMTDHPGAPPAYPEIHYATRTIRAAAAAGGDPDRLNLWAGTGFRAVRDDAAENIIERLTRGIRQSWERPW